MKTVMDFLEIAYKLCDLDPNHCYHYVHGTDGYPKLTEGLCPWERADYTGWKACRTTFTSDDALEFARRVKRHRTAALRPDYVYFMSATDWWQNPQYLVRYLNGSFGYPSLGDAFRWTGNPAEWDSIQIHKDDVDRFAWVARTDWTDDQLAVLEAFNRNAVLVAMLHGNQVEGVHFRPLAPATKDDPRCWCGGVNKNKGEESCPLSYANGMHERKSCYGLTEREAMYLLE